MVKKRSPISLSKYLKIFNLAHGPKKIVVEYKQMVWSITHHFSSIRDHIGTTPCPLLTVEDFGDALILGTTSRPLPTQGKR
jgi:hypothetical protein